MRFPKEFINYPDAILNSADLRLPSAYFRNLDFMEAREKPCGRPAAS